MNLIPVKNDADFQEYVDAIVFHCGNNFAIMKSLAEKVITTDTVEGDTFVDMLKSCVTKGALHMHMVFDDGIKGVVCYEVLPSLKKRVLCMTFIPEYALNHPSCQFTCCALINEKGCHNV